MNQESTFYKGFLMLSQRIENHTIAISIRHGLTHIIPLLLIGSFVLVFMSLPVPGYPQLMEKIFGINWSMLFELVSKSTFGILSIFMVLSISYSYATVIITRQPRFYFSRIINSCVALCSFVILSSISKDGFSFNNFGVTSTFEAIFAALLSSFLFTKLCSVKFLRLTSYSDGANIAYSESISSITPAVITIFFFAGLHVLLVSVLGITDIKSTVFGFFTGLSNNVVSPYGTAILFIFIIHFLWFFGIHGSNVMEPVSQSLYVSAMTLNITKVSAGAVPMEIFTKPFFDVFVLMGGCGSTLCLIVSVFLTVKHKNIRRLAKLSVAPVIFNINEMVTFGIPIVLNPIYLIPFVLTPLVFTTVSYLAMSAGIVPYTTQLVEWTTPVFLSGYASTGSIYGSLLQLFNLVVGVLIYMPFVRLAQRLSEMQMKNSLLQICKMTDCLERNEPRSLLGRSDDIGSVARFLTNDLEHDLRNNKLDLHYQPQTDHHGVVVGVEALLRWKHELFGYIYPPTIIQLAEESGLIDELGFWVFERACSDKKNLDALGFKPLSVSVNVSAVQLENTNVSNEFKSIISRYSVSPDMLDIEVTEQVALSGSQKVIDSLKSFKSMGMKLTMDDFGMGHSSLMYLMQYNFDTIKLDGSLVRPIMTNHHCSDIISSIVYLSESMRFTVIAEYVETEEQKALLLQLGCRCYQGYLYSPALPIDRLIEYLSNHIPDKGCLSVPNRD